VTVAFNYKLSALYVPQILRVDDEITAIKPTAITNGVLQVQIFYQWIDKGVRDQLDTLI